MAVDNAVKILRAFSLDAKLQLELYPRGVNVAEELALDWEEAFANLEKDDGEIASFLSEFDRLLFGVSGIEEVWCNEALADHSVWKKLRDVACKLEEKTDRLN